MLRVSKVLFVAYCMFSLTACFGSDNGGSSSSTLVPPTDTEIISDITGADAVEVTGGTQTGITTALVSVAGGTKGSGDVATQFDASEPGRGINGGQMETAMGKVSTDIAITADGKLNVNLGPDSADLTFSDISLSDFKTYNTGDNSGTKIATTNAGTRTISPAQASSFGNFQGDVTEQNGKLIFGTKANSTTSYLTSVEFGYWDTVLALNGEQNGDAINESMRVMMPFVIESAAATRTTPANGASFTGIAKGMVTDGTVYKHLDGTSQIALDSGFSTGSFGATFSNFATMSAAIEVNGSGALTLKPGTRFTFDHAGNTTGITFINGSGTSEINGQFYGPSLDANEAAGVFKHTETTKKQFIGSFGMNKVVLP